MILVRSAVSEGKTLSQAAAVIGISTSALHGWLTQNGYAEERQALSEAGRSQRGQPLSREQAVSRLRMVTTFGVAETSRALGVSQQAIHHWLRKTSPDGAAAHLADLTDGV